MLQITKKNQKERQGDKGKKRDGQTAKKEPEGETRRQRKKREVDRLPKSMTCFHTGLCLHGHSDTRVRKNTLTRMRTRTHSHTQTHTHTREMIV